MCLNANGRGGYCLNQEKPGCGDLQGFVGPMILNGSC